MGTSTAFMFYMGTRGMGALRNLMLGSTVSKLLHVAAVPVIVAP
jgi:nucleotide-binding universal stress UspA family protein